MKTEEQYLNELAEEAHQIELEQAEQDEAEQYAEEHADEINQLFDDDVMRGIPESEMNKSDDNQYKDIIEDDAYQNMKKYMVEHNYEKADADIYRNDPEFQKLNQALIEAGERIDRHNANVLYPERKVGSDIKNKKSTDFVDKVMNDFSQVDPADKGDIKNKFNPEDFDQ